ncbi:MAG: tetratricopeptide repeat protein [Methanomassiliicoccales archaeon]|nr:MAG: tetratricopeptide repeat protein [Methanomassiliicoccales archaeon]
MVQTFSQSERVLLLLLEHDLIRSPEAPFVLCQEGMAEKLGMQIQNMSRTLMKMQKEGLIIERLAHVSGVGRRRKVYQLTEVGRTAASTVRDTVLRSNVVVQEGPTSRSMSVSDLISYLRDAGQTMSLLEAADHVAKGRLVIDDLRSGRNRSGSKCPSLSIGKPDPVEVVGREDELAKLESFLYDQGVRCVLVWGLPGMGKTTLGMALFERCRGRFPLFWYTIRGFDSETDILTPLWSVLRESGVHVGPNSSADEMAKLFGQLCSELSKWKGVIFIDDAHKANERANTAINLLIEACRSQVGTRLILISRTMTRPFIQDHDGMVALELQGLRPRDAEELARRTGAERADVVLERTKGNPLLIQIAARGGQVNGVRTAADYVDDLWASLNEVERRALKVLAIYRDFVPLSALNIAAEVIFGLRSKGIVQKMEDRIMLHDLVRNRVLDLLTDDERRAGHSLAGHYYLGQGGELIFEGLYHLGQTGDESAFIDVLAEQWEKLVERPDELLAIIDGVRLPERSPALLYWRSRTLTALERYDEAETGLEKVLASIMTGPELKAKTLEALAEVHHLVDELDQALSRHKEALELYKMNGDRRSQARELLNIGRIYRIRGDFENALATYDMASDVMPDDKKLAALLSNNRGMVFWSWGKLDEAEKEFREAAKKAREIRDLRSEGMALTNLAEMYQESLRHEEMLLALKDASDAFIRSGDLDHYAECEVMIASHLANIGKDQEALTKIEEAIIKTPGHILTTGHSTAKARLYLAAMRVLREMGRPKETIEKGRTAERLRHMEPDVAARIDLEMALAYAEIGDLDRAIELLDRASMRLREIRDEVGLTLVLIEKGELEERKGDLEKATKLYKEAAWRAEGTKDMLGLATSLEYLSYISEGEEGAKAGARAADIYKKLGMLDRALRLQRGQHPVPET